MVYIVPRDENDAFQYEVKTEDPKATYIQGMKYTFYHNANNIYNIVL